jgi:hypothetical protein
MDLTTTYLGLRLRNPLVASASPLSSTLDGIHRLHDAGVGAIVMYSLSKSNSGSERCAGPSYWTNQRTTAYPATPHLAAAPRVRARGGARARADYLDGT